MVESRNCGREKENDFGGDGENDFWESTERKASRREVTERERFLSLDDGTQLSFRL